MVQCQKKLKASKWKVALTFAPKFNPIGYSPVQNCPVNCQPRTSCLLSHCVVFAFFNDQQMECSIHCRANITENNCPKSRGFP